ncbi:hypothetical protein MMC27_001041 [Xylographa pallens]|nr:hypothetical protein [Xylographa pallens]
MASSRTRENGYFDCIYSVFEAHRHPIILVEDGAMRWMGLRMCPEENLDLLVRNSQADSILTGLLATGVFERVDQDIGYRLDDPYTTQVPRLRDTRCDPGSFSCVSLWTEAIYMLEVEAAELVAVKDIHTWNVNLAEERFATVPETAYLTSTAQIKEGTRILPRIMSSAKVVPIFVPSIPKICDAVLDQLEYRTTHAEEFQGKKVSSREPPPPRAMSVIGLGQKAALLEAYVVTVSLLPPPLRAEFPIIGGASLVMLGSQRRTEDADFAVSAAALMEFEEAASNDPRFSKGNVADWTYSCQGKGIEEVKVVKMVGEGFRAGMGELVRMKANTYTARGEQKDVEDVGFLLDKMEETGEGFEGVELEEEDLENLEAAAADSGERHSDLLKELVISGGAYSVTEGIAKWDKMVKPTLRLGLRL